MSAEATLPAPLVALAAEVGQHLQQNRHVVSTAESCTGGLVAAALTAIAGSSAWFSCGWVTYANAAKTRQLHVSEALLAEQGAVSEAVARAMAEGALQEAGADVALAISGIAGPGGGTAEKPVGTVCFAWARKAGATRSETCHFAGGRDAVRLAAALHALQGVRVV